MKLRPWLAGACTAALLAEAGWARAAWSIEGSYVHGLGPRVQRALTLVTGVLPFSLAELLIVSAIAVAAVWVARAAVALARGPERGAVLRDRALTAWAVASAIGLGFYTAWGLSYGRPAADERLGWSDASSPLAHIHASELVPLADRLVDRANEAYLDLHGWPDAGAPSEPPGGMAAVDASIDRAYARLAEMGLDPQLAPERGPAKPFVLSGALTWLALGGFYFPLTGEANVNAWQPAWQRAHTIAHEKAHQRFVASEDEANFYGFLAGVYSDDPFARYGAWLFAQRQVLVTLRDSDPYAAMMLIERRLPGVQRDVNFAHAFWSGYTGPVSTASRAVNDKYLRFNGVEGGVESYSQSVVLVTEWLRRHPDLLGSESVTSRSP